LTLTTQSLLYGSEEKSSVGSEPPFREYLSTEEQDKPLLEAVSRERLLKRQAGTGLEGAPVICESWRLAVAL
jgi:hypothetical protein